MRSIVRRNYANLATHTIISFSMNSKCHVISDIEGNDPISIYYSGRLTAQQCKPIQLNKLINFHHGTRMIS